MLIQSISELTSIANISDLSSNQTYIEVSLSDGSSFKSKKLLFKDIFEWVNLAISNQISVYNQAYETSCNDLYSKLQDEIIARIENDNYISSQIKATISAGDLVNLIESLSNKYLIKDSSKDQTVTGPVIFSKTLTACATSAMWN